MPHRSGARTTASYWRQRAASKSILQETTSPRPEVEETSAPSTVKASTGPSPSSFWNRFSIRRPRSITARTTIATATSTTMKDVLALESSTNNNTKQEEVTEAKKLPRRSSLASSVSAPCSDISEPPAALPIRAVSAVGAAATPSVVAAIVGKAEHDEICLRTLEEMLSTLSLETVSDWTDITDDLTMQTSGATVPAISLRDYCFRLVRYFNRIHSCTENSLQSPGFRYLAVGFIYIQRFLDRNPSFSLNTVNVHRMFAIASILAEKCNEDFSVSAGLMASIAGLAVEELHVLESVFCTHVDFCLFVSTAQLNTLLSRFEIPLLPCEL